MFEPAVAGLDSKTYSTQNTTKSSTFFNMDWIFQLLLINLKKNDLGKTAPYKYIVICHTLLIVYYECYFRYHHISYKKRIIISSEYKTRCLC